MLRARLNRLSAPAQVWCCGLLLLATCFARAQEGTLVLEAPPAPPFAFSGGSPEDFVAAVQKHFSVDWSTIVTIPAMMRDERLPKMTIAALDPFVLLKLYNEVAIERPSLGTWAWEKDPNKPPFVVLVPNAKRVAAELDKQTDSMISVSLRDVPRPVWGAVSNEIETVRKEIEEALAKLEVQGLPPNQVSSDTRTAMLLIRGSAEFQEKAKAIVEAHRDPEGSRRMAEEIRAYSLMNLQPAEWPSLLAEIEANREKQTAIAAAEKRLFHPEGRNLLDAETRILFAIGTADYGDVVLQTLKEYRQRKAAEANPASSPEGARSSNR